MKLNTNTLIILSLFKKIDFISKMMNDEDAIDYIRDYAIDVYNCKEVLDPSWNGELTKKGFNVRLATTTEEVMKCKNKYQSTLIVINAEDEDDKTISLFMILERKRVK